jgi:type IV fimbrial biogenesis protein FimT
MRATRSRGFTIIELMIVLVMVGVMVAIAAPSMRDLVVRMRLKAASSDLHSSLILARSEAIKRNAGMQIVPVNAADWSRGWTVRVQASGVVLTTQEAFPNVTFVTTNAAYTTTAVATVNFSGTGRESGSGGAGVAFVLSSATFPNIQARCVTIDPSGRPAVRQDRDFNAANGCN